MTTFKQLTEETLATLRGFSRVQEQSTHLTAGVDFDDLTWTVANGTVLHRGRAEVGDEIIQIDSVTGNTVTIAPYGRGCDSSTAWSHSVGDQVSFSPMFSRFRVKQEINNTITSLGGLLPAIKNSIVTSNQYGDYDLPAGAQEVVSVQWEQIPGHWVFLSNWRQVNQADVTDFPSGKSVRVPGVPMGATLKIGYTTDPAPMDDDADVFTTTTGLPQSCMEVVKLGALWRYASTLDLGNLDAGAVGAAELAGRNQPGQAMTLAQSLYRMFAVRREEEQRKILNRMDGATHG